MNYGPASKYYDLFASRDDISFYEELATRHGKKALELGVGTGRVAIELAKAGVTVWGIDNSRHMLNQARQKLKKERVVARRRVKLKLGDMREFDLKELFPFIYIASSTFEHCITEEHQKSCLRCAYNSLERKAVLAFDISQPEKARSEASWWIDRRELDKAEEVVRTIFSRRDPKSNIVSVNLFFDVYKGGILKDRYYEHGEARVSSKEDIEKMLEDVGFRIVKVFGDFDKSAYDAKSRKAIFIVTKP